MSEPIPPFLESSLRRFDDTLAEVRTRRIRAVRHTPAPDPDATDTAGRLAGAAAEPDAPAELRAVARAVAEERATWDDVVHGRVTAAPEVAALVRASARLVDAQADDAADDEDDDFSLHSQLGADEH